MKEDSAPEELPEQPDPVSAQRTGSLPVSVAQLAELAIQCAQLQGEDAPNIFEALLLVHACERVAISPNYFGEAIELATSRERYGRVKTILQATAHDQRTKGDKEAAIDFLEFRLGVGDEVVPGLGIKMPKAYPVAISSAMALVSGEPNAPRRQKYYKEYIAAGNPDVGDSLPDRASFWEFAQAFHSFCPQRFSPRKSPAAKSSAGHSESSPKPKKVAKRGRKKGSKAARKRLN